MDDASVGVREGGEVGGGFDESYGVGDRARWGRRLGAWFIDQAALFLSVVVLVGVPVGAVLDEDSAGVVWAVIILLYPVVLVAYFTAFHARVGQTMGKRLLGIKVVDASSSGPIGYARAFRRSVATAILWALVIPGLIDGLRSIWRGRVGRCSLAVPILRTSRLLAPSPFPGGRRRVERDVGRDQLPSLVVWGLGWFMEKPAGWAGF